MIINISDLIKVLEQRKVQLSKWTDQDRANERIDEIDCILDVDIDSLAKCGAEHAKKDETSVPNALEESDKSLEEAAEEYAKGEGLNNALGGWEDMYDAFIAGAKRQKEQMMKDAVDGIARIGYPFLSSNPFVDIQESKDSWCKLMRKFMDGDKVRIVVLKEED